MIKHDELRGLLAAATPGPWHHRQAGMKSPYNGDEYDWVASAAEPGQHSKNIIGRKALYGGSPDYALIVAAVNALPGLLDEIGYLREIQVKEKNAQLRIEQLEAELTALLTFHAATELDEHAQALHDQRARIEELEAALREVMLFVESVTRNERIELGHEDTVRLGNARVAGRAALAAKSGEKR